jgi:hypothetical protein
MQVLVRCPFHPPLTENISARHLDYCERMVTFTIQVLAYGAMESEHDMWLEVIRLDGSRDSHRHP